LFISFQIQSMRFLWELPQKMSSQGCLHFYKAPGILRPILNYDSKLFQLIHSVNTGTKPTKRVGYSHKFSKEIFNPLKFQTSLFAAHPFFKWDLRGKKIIAIHGFKLL
jgi:hypothetical protein